MPDYPETPITREEQYPAAALDGGELPEPILREEQYLNAIAEAMQGMAVSVQSGKSVSITQNGQATVEPDTGYDAMAEVTVTVNVPNTYAAGDEGKVVSSGALVAQTAHAAVTPTTSDQTVDTTTNNSITITGDANLVAGNIKDGVTLFDVTGSYTGGGGNPNTVETISNVNVASIPAAKIVEIVAGLADNSLTAYVSTSGIAYNLMPAVAFAALDSSNYLMFTACATDGGYDSASEFFMLGYTDTGDYDGFCYKLEGGSVQGGAAYSTNVQCTLTIIHHPLPSA